MSISTEFQWSVQPQGLFEETVVFQALGAAVRIVSGTATAITPGDASADTALRDAIEEELRRRVVAQGYTRRTVAKLDRGAVSVIDADGNRSIFATLTCAVAVVDGHCVITVVSDHNGNALTDARRCRLDRETERRERVGTWVERDRVLDKLLASHARAAGDPSDFLVHLYEIRDALHAKFGSRDQARQVLGIPPAQWERFDALANDSTLLESRHRGRSHGELRPASNEEREEAWRLAEALVEAYVGWLETTLGSVP